MRQSPTALSGTRFGVGVLESGFMDSVRGQHADRLAIELLREEKPIRIEIRFR